MGKFKYKLAETENWKDKCLRSMAELDNFKRRTAQEKQQIAANAAINIIEQLLPLLDTIESALKMNIEGFEAIAVQIKDIFTKLGVTEIEALDKEFNPHLHNAVMHIEDETLGKSIIVEEFAKGYMLDGKIIRHSMVKVAN